MSAQEQMRKMLDELMGTTRNGEAEGRYRFTDPKVCRSFLLNCCPHDILASTRADLGACSKVHDPALRADYELAARKKDYGYHIDAMQHLTSFVADCDRRTEISKKRLAETQESLSAEVNHKADMVHELAEMLGKKIADAEKHGEDGNVEKSMETMAEVEEIRKKKISAEEELRNSMPASTYQQQKLRVCEVCGAYLGLQDNDRRLADHFGGKLHLGFIEIREKLQWLQGWSEQQRERRRAERSREEEDDDDEYERERERDRERERERERDRYKGSRDRRDRGDRDSYQDRERDRDRDRERRRDRRRSRSRSHSKSKSQRSKRSRSRSKDRRRRSRSRSHDRRRRTRSRDRERRHRSRSRDRRRSRSREHKKRSRSHDRDKRRHSRSHSHDSNPHERGKPSESAAHEEYEDGEALHEQYAEGSSVKQESMSSPEDGERQDGFEQRWENGEEDEEPEKEPAF